MKTKILQWTAIITIIEIGLLHMTFAQYAYDTATYLGYLFVANFLGALFSAYGIYQSKFWGWLAGAGLAGISMAGYIWSRTMGLPGTLTGDWGFLPGTLALGLEALFLLVTILQPWKQADFASEIKIPRFLGYFVTVVVVAVMAVGTMSAYQWMEESQQFTGEGIASLEKLMRTPALTAEEFEQQYGMRVTLAGISLLDSIVDVRIKVIDPDKADILLAGDAALLVDGKTLVYAPDAHHHSDVKPGQIHVIFFPTQNNTVRIGSAVSLVFGNVLVESVITR